MCKMIVLYGYEAGFEEGWIVRLMKAVLGRCVQLPTPEARGAKWNARMHAAQTMPVVCTDKCIKVRIFPCTHRPHCTIRPVEWFAGGQTALHGTTVLHGTTGANAYPYPHVSSSACYTVEPTHGQNTDIATGNAPLFPLGSRMACLQEEGPLLRHTMQYVVKVLSKH